MYKIIKEFPGHKLGEHIEDNSDLQPFLYKEYFEYIVKSEATSIEGNIVTTGDLVFYIDDNKTIKRMYLSGYIPDKVYYSNAENALNDLVKEIKLELENETIEGENIPLYSVCTKADWQLSETTSLKLYQRLYLNVSSKPSLSWRHFRTIKERDSYIEWNKPMYSKNDLCDLDKYTKEELKGKINYIIGNEVPVHIDSMNITEQIMKLL